MSFHARETGVHTGVFMTHVACEFDMWGLGSFLGKVEWTRTRISVMKESFTK